MRCEYDIFEKFPDGTAIWRWCAFGQFETERKLQHLVEQSSNDFFAIDIQASVSGIRLVFARNRPLEGAAEEC